ncbi:MAG: 6-pyruvoyl trahydropterin synthase family protein [Candidatus Thorarchaeota archaeon]
MFKIKKTFEVSVMHHLDLDYDSPCVRDHGHNLKITVYCASEELNKNGMVIDFEEIKRKVHSVIDHRNLNDIKDIGFVADSDENYSVNPTAERLAEWIFYQVPHCYRVDVQETEGNVATYEDHTGVSRRR